MPIWYVAGILITFSPEFAGILHVDGTIRAGDADLILAGGMESMSRAPFLLNGVRQGWKFGDQKAVEVLALSTPLPNPGGGIWPKCARQTS